MKESKSEIKTKLNTSKKNTNTDSDNNAIGDIDFNAWLEETHVGNTDGRAGVPIQEFDMAVESIMLDGVLEEIEEEYVSVFLDM